MSKPLTRYLLVEGNSDKRVIESLCIRHGIETPQFPPVDGINQLLDGIPGRINSPGLEVMGIVVDADLNREARWQSLRDRFQDRTKLAELAYLDFPAMPSVNGWISEGKNQPRVGIWLMPDNQRTGILEDFVSDLIPDTDVLKLKAGAVLQELEAEGIHRYTEVSRPKAFIYTWLAWQREPGRPMGMSITHRDLPHDSPAALAFVDWLRRLFNPGASIGVV
ncbi:MAG: DUF3226 domain-containing protein [Thermomicrobiales bacterium]